MRRKISLYIKDKLVDLDNDSLVLFNYAQGDMENPAIVKNSYSQSIALPRTANNNAIFGHLGRADRVTTDATFNPLKRESFAIYNELNEVIESGYVKVDSINEKYNVTLYGGLGGFFYSLAYTEDGDKKTLADLYFKYGTTAPAKASEIAMTISKDKVAEAWTSLEESGTGIWSLINFASCYNGFPACKFSADKATYKGGTSRSSRIPDLYDTKVVDGTTYTTKMGANGYILLEFGHKHTEMDIQDLRSYLQRPVISVKGLLDAYTIAENTGEYTFVIDDSVKTLADDWYNTGWMTLKMFDRDNLNPASFKLADLLSKTATPTDYLVGFAKMFGLIFTYDHVSKTITLMTRNAYYSGDVMDIERMIDRSSKPRTIPYAMDAKFYVWEVDNFGEVAKSEEERTGKKVGSQWVNTNFDFSDDKRAVLENVPYKGAIDVKETDIHFFVLPGQTEALGSEIVNYMCKFKIIESVKWKLYHWESGQTQEEEFSPTPTLRGDAVTYEQTHSEEYRQLYMDFMYRVQLHSDEDKAEDGDNVLLFYNGMVNTPVVRIDTETEVTRCPIRFHLSDDSSSMLALNNEQPCWEMSPEGNNVLEISKMPSFLRANGDKTFDFGSGDKTDLYSAFWRNYIADRYNLDSRVVTCKVNFAGVQVDSSLLRRFYWFDDSLWVLNKIINHSLTTYDPVECEFIKIQDKENYSNGQE